MSSAVREAPDDTVFEVCTTSADALRARLQVLGELRVDTVGLLSSAVAAHLRSGRRYVHIDLSGAAGDDPRMLSTVTAVYDSVVGVGGRVAFDRPGPTGDALATHVAALRARG